MSNETALVKAEQHQLYRQSTDAAGICKEIVVATSQDIGGKRYVRAEGWQAIATAHGCVASARDVERVEGGIRAVGEIRRIDTGVIIATAEGFVGDDEVMWQKRPEYARRAMAQTRAISRACRSAFAHVIVMMRAGLETTPAEEVPAEGFNSPAKAVKAEASVQQPAGETLVTLTCPIDRVVVKNGESRGKPWRKFGAFVNGEWYSTFDAELGEALQVAAYDVGTAFKLTIDRSKKFPTIVKVEAVGAVEEPKEKDENLPF